jgi:hypothetical protein
MNLTDAAKGAAVGAMQTVKGVMDGGSKMAASIADGITGTNTATELDKSADDMFSRMFSAKKRGNGPHL